MLTSDTLTLISTSKFFKTCIDLVELEIDVNRHLLPFWLRQWVLSEWDQSLNHWVNQMCFCDSVSFLDAFLKAQVLADQHLALSPVLLVFLATKSIDLDLRCEILFFSPSWVLWDWQFCVSSICRLGGHAYRSKANRLRHELLDQCKAALNWSRFVLVLRWDFEKVFAVTFVVVGLV